MSFEGTGCRGFYVVGLCVSLGLLGCTFRTMESPVGGGGSGGNGGVAGSGAHTGSGGSGAGGTAPAPTHCDPCTDFPTAPIIDMNMPAGGSTPPANVGETFGPAGSGSATGGPCLSDPEPNSLFPKNWLRPRFVVQPGAGEDVFEIRLHADIESNDLVVYTTAASWTMPGPLWAALSANVVNQPITVSVRGMVSSSGTVALGPTETIMIAPTDASGTIVYWTTSGVTALKGFSVGQESVVTVLTPANTPGQCVGCHSSTPGGEFIGFSNSTSTTNGDPSHIEIRSGTAPANQPAFLTADAQALLQRVSQELPVFSPAHWTEGDYVTVFMHADSTSASGQNTHLLWIDLEATSQTQGVGWGEFMRNGDPNPAVAYPFISHDGKRIVYVSAPSANPSGILQHGDLYSVDYGNRAGGTATPIAGASTSTYSEFYPALSSDDSLLAYTRLTDGANSYNNVDSEVFIINSNGGTPVRHAANDPGACIGKTSPGITNSWPKWSPTVGVDSGKSYYWITFSSTRSGNPQLYLAAVVVDEIGNLTTTPALYLWNQPPTENNHTPAWDTFIIPAPG
jgi:mono/diheme cytochrome c family protein